LVKAIGADQSQALVDLTRRARGVTGNVSAIFFSFGSILFFYLFFKSRYIPWVLSVLGVVASVIATIMCFAV
jgi:hypothetical protein